MRSTTFSLNVVDRSLTYLVFNQEYMCANKMYQLPGFSDKPILISTITEQPPEIISVQRNSKEGMQDIRSITRRFAVIVINSLTNEEISKLNLFINEKTPFKNFPEDYCESYLVEVKLPSNGSITFIYESVTLE